MTIEEFLKTLPDDRRRVIAAVRDVMIENLDPDYEEGVEAGAIVYSVPHRVFPAGYHCDPKKPLPFATISSQKKHVSLHLMALYIGGEESAGEDSEARRFREAWTRTGKKLDAGKGCVRFKTLDQVPLEVLGETIRRLPARVYAAKYQEALERRPERPRGRTARRSGR